mmetsp:Transcript_11150/g.16703  ORF Transcript_11150/g.16703 Transcript_11150/m.16703 type:complete len:218 (+) Transcript_11150:1338-1991(+)
MRILGLFRQFGDWSCSGPVSDKQLLHFFSSPNSGSNLQFKRTRSEYDNLGGRSSFAARVFRGLATHCGALFMAAYFPIVAYCPESALYPAAINASREQARSASTRDKLSIQPANSFKSSFFESTICRNGPPATHVLGSNRTRSTRTEQNLGLVLEVHRGGSKAQRNPFRPTSQNSSLCFSHSRTDPSGSFSSFRSILGISTKCLCCLGCNSGVLLSM